jgi:thioesterase domain-containing protein
MIDTTTLLSTLRQRNVRLWIEDGRVKCNAPVGALDDELRATLVSQKDAVLVHLRHAETLKGLPPAIVPIKIEGSKPPIFAVSGHGGDIFCLRALARRLDAEQPVLGVQPPGLDGTRPMNSVEALARYEIEQIQQYWPSGPYLIAGHCSGGTIAFEVAQQLAASGQEVSLLALIGSPFPTRFRHLPQILLRVSRYADALVSGSFVRKLQRRLKPIDYLEEVSPTVLAARERVDRATIAAVRMYRPRRYEGQIDLFVTGDKWHRSNQWRAVAGNIREYRLGSFEINDLLLTSHIEVLAAALQDCLGSIDYSSSSTERRRARSA